jgi:hypothetical protein
MSWSALCVHCRQTLIKHARGKCLFGATSFKVAVCPECNQAIDTPANSGAGDQLYHAICPRDAWQYREWSSS